MKKIFTPVAIAAVALSTIFVSCKDDKETNVAVESVALNATTVTTLNVYGVGAESTLQLGATILPANATDKDLIWESSNNNIASVSENGLITANNAGTVIISVFSNADESKFDEITLTVTRGDHPTYGQIDFLTADTVKIGDQIWSDVVVVEKGAVEDPSEFDGGILAKKEGDEWTVKADHKVAILKNPGYGDLFSWQAVNNLKSALCPYPWRTPTEEDFRQLDRSLGGTGWANASPDGNDPEQRRDEAPQELIDAYLNEWAATYGGLVSDGVLSAQGTPEGGSAMYWSSSEVVQANEPQPYNMGRSLTVTYGNVTGMAFSKAEIQPTPEQVAATEGNLNSLVASCGCPAGSFMLQERTEGEEKVYYCGYIGETITRLTHPYSNPGKNQGLMLRCVK
ncbi:MAG: Ig-like domain-containing protein [Bacteroidales bacterium]|jgi:uncharacterized protein (TIGR02145 family)|nr:Ig-like domain-containing protein [Bacteroidales bacterium]